MTTEDGRGTFEFDDGAFSGDAVVTIEQIPCGSAPEGFRMGDTCFRITATVDGEPVTELGADLTICIEYSAGDLAAAGDDPTLLAYAYFDEDAGEWQFPTTVVNETEGTVCTTTRHISDWAVLGEVVAGGWPWWYYLLIGLGALVIILVIVVLLTQRQRKKRPSGKRPAEFEPEEMPEPL